MMRLYKILLGLYPYDFRSWFGAEMTAAFAKSAAACPPGWPYVRFTLAELAGLARGAAFEWIAKWTGDRLTRARYLPDWRMMRPAGIPREVFFAGPAAERERGGHRCSPDT